MRARIWFMVGAVSLLAASSPVVAAEQRNPIILFTDDLLNDEQWPLGAPPGIDAEAAWTVSDGTDALIAIVDTGIDDSHPDLAGRIAGRVVVCDLCVPGDQLGHGTAVAGVAAAITDNTHGIAGASKAMLLDIEVYSPDGASFSDVADGIKIAADMGADVINLSLGCEAPCYVSEIHHALAYAVAKGSTPVCAAGNSYSGVGFPASDPLCVAVSALDTDGTLATFSNHGPEVDIAAPGVDIWTTQTGGGYQMPSGTSVAAPFVSAIAAMVPGSPDAVAAHLKSTATPSVQPIEEVGAGWANACAAVGAAGCSAGLPGTLPRTVTESYLTGASVPPLTPFPVGPNCGPEVPPIELSYSLIPNDANIGGACFGLLGPESAVTVTITDATALPVGAGFAWLRVTPFGEEGLGAGPLCGTATMSPPEGANQLRIWTQGPAAILACGPTTGQASTGTISVHAS